MQVELKITVTEQGQIGVHGPLDQPLVCYGLLEMARQAIQKHHEQAQRIVKPVGLIPPAELLRRREG